LLPVFLAAVAMPALLASAALAERRGTLAALQREQERLGQGLAFERRRGERMARERRAREEAEQRVAARTIELRQANERLLAETAGREEALEELRGQREQVSRMARMLVPGELSCALAHELNQPLAAILANAQAARRCLARPGADLGSIRAILDDIVEADQRADAVIRRLRALFRNEAPALRPVVVDALVRETLDLAHGCLAPRNVQVLLELRKGLAVLGDHVQLQQVLLNLVINASDAMQAMPPGQRRLRLASIALPDGTVQITVADSGPGIAADALDKVFDPRFTTKKAGLGVGLSISRAIVSQHGGKIEAFNNPEGGCVLRVCLPAHVEVPDEH
jgi:C4-dicarboxylate-specific signal transduction histidine kinase